MLQSTSYRLFNPARLEAKLTPGCFLIAAPRLNLHNAFRVEFWDNLNGMPAQPALTRKHNNKTRRTKGGPRKSRRLTKHYQSQPFNFARRRSLRTFGFAWPFVSFIT